MQEKAWQDRELREQILTPRAAWAGHENPAMLIFKHLMSRNVSVSLLLSTNTLKSSGGRHGWTVQHYRENSPPASISPEPPSAPKPRHPKAMCSSCSLSSTFSHRRKEQHWSGKHSEPKMPWSPALSWPQLHHANQSPGALMGRLMLVGLGGAWVCISDRCPSNAGWAVLRPHSQTKGLMRMWEGRWLLWSWHVFWDTESDHISSLLFVVRVKFNLPA